MTNNGTMSCYVVTFHVTIMLGLGFVRFLSAIFKFCYFYYDKLIGILFKCVSWQPFCIGILDFKIRTSDFKFQKAPLSSCTFIYLFVKWKLVSLLAECCITVSLRRWPDIKT